VACTVVFDTTHQLLISHACDLYSIVPSCGTADHFPVYHYLITNYQCVLSSLHRLRVLHWIDSNPPALGLLIWWVITRIFVVRLAFGSKHNNVRSAPVSYHKVGGENGPLIAFWTSWRFSLPLVTFPPSVMWIYASCLGYELFSGARVRNHMRLSRASGIFQVISFYTMRVWRCEYFKFHTSRAWVN